MIRQQLQRKDEGRNTGAEIKIVEMGNSSADVAKYLPTTLDACEDGWDYIVCGSPQMVEPVQTAAEEFPEVKFIVYDAEVPRKSEEDLPNVYSALFKQNESADYSRSDCYGHE